MKTHRSIYRQYLSAKVFVLLFIIFSAPIILHAQAPGIVWQKCLGGSSLDRVYSVIQTFDGGYVIGGYTCSLDGDIIGTHTDTTGLRTYIPADFWVIKLSSLGNIEWQKCLGGKGDDRGGTIIQTADSGYIIAGSTVSTDGDVSGLHIDTTVDKHLHADAWITKLSSSGEIEWEKCIGGTGGDGAASLIKTFDGGYLFTGYAGSLDGDLSFLHYGQFWVCKLSNMGKIEWQNCFGGRLGQDIANSVIQTSDSGYAMIGFTSSFDADVSGHHGWKDLGASRNDIWIVRINSVGKLLWEKCLGGTNADYGGTILQTSDHGFIIGGSTNSDDGDVIGYHHPDSTFRETDTLIIGKDNMDAWIVKIDTSGNIQWQKCYGGLGSEGAGQIISTSDGGYIFLGNTTSTDGDVAGLHGERADVWLVKINSVGNILWQKCFGGTNEDYGGYYGWYNGGCFFRTSDNGFIFAGSSTSIDGDVSGFHTNISTQPDIWVVKLEALSKVKGNYSSNNSLLSLSSYPNPATKSTSLNFELPKSSPVGISMYNVLGEQVLQIPESQYEVGHHEMPLDVSKFVDGTYFIRVTACGMTETQVVQLMR